MDGLTADTIANETAALRRLARALTRDAAAADDLVQETWLAAVRQPPAEDRPVRPWLARVLRNKATSAVRSARRSRAREEAVALTASTESRSVDELDVARQLLEEIERLSADERALLVLVYWEGLSSAECAAELGRPASTVRTQLQRTLERLRTRLDEHRGGRAAWMAAMMPLAGDGRIPMIGAKALALTSLAGMIVLVVVVIAPNGCGSELANAPVETRGEKTRRDATPPAMGAVPGNRGDAATGPASANAAVVRKADGVEIQRPSHPKTAYHYAFQDMLAPLAECREGRGVGSVRVVPTVVFALDHDPLVESVELAQADNVSAAEQECVRQTFLAMDIPQPELDAELDGWRFTPTHEFTFDEVGELSHRAINRRAPMWLFTQRKLGEDLRAAVANCDRNARADATVDVRITFAADTGALAVVEALGEHAASKVGACAVAAIREFVRPTDRFEPKRPEDAMMDCTFRLDVAGMYTCERPP